MQLTGWGCGGTRKIIRVFELPLPAADAQTLCLKINHAINVSDSWHNTFGCSLFGVGNPLITYPRK